MWPKDTLPLNGTAGTHLRVGETTIINAAGEKLYIKGFGNVFLCQITSTPINVVLPEESFTINVGATVEVNNTTENPLPIKYGAFDSVNNSTDVQLAANGVFTGLADEVSEYGTIIISVRSNGASAQNGLAFQVSNDQVNWYDLEQYTYMATGISVYSMSPGGRYFRIRYTNSGTATTGFFIHTTYKQCYVKPSSHRVGDNINGENDAELVKAVLAAEMPNGTYTNINTTSGGNLKVSLQEFDTNFGKLPVETVGTPTVARSIVSTVDSTNVVLTSTVRRIAIYARTVDIRYKVGSTAQVANENTSHYLPKNNRVIMAVPSSPNIAVIRDSHESTNGIVEITELV